MFPLKYYLIRIYQMPHEVIMCADGSCNGNGGISGVSNTVAPIEWISTNS